MKTEIQRVKYNKNSNKPDKCEWYSWKAVCDDCGCVIHEFDEWISTREPKADEKDYCLNCLRKWYDEKR